MKKILVPFDFSDSAVNALEYACFLADNLGSQITVLFVLNVFGDIDEDEKHLQAIKEAMIVKEKELKVKLESHIEKNGQKALSIKTGIVKNISVPAGIIEFINSGNFDLVVMGTYGMAGVGGWFPGSVSEKIIKLSPVPVLTVHKDWHKRELKTLLVPIDFSEGSRYAARQAMGLLTGFQTELKIIFVIEEDEYPDIFSPSFHFENKENQNLKKKILDELADFTGIPPVQAEYIIRVGLPHDEIKEVAKERFMDLIAMPKTGQDLFEKILLGSTTERIIRASPCPVLTIPFSGRNTSKTDYHFRFIKFLATHKLGTGRVGP